MQLNQEQFTFLTAVINGEFSNQTMFEGTSDKVARVDYIAQLAPELYDAYTYIGLATKGHLDSHPEASFYLALASIVENQPGVDTPVWLWLRGAAEVNVGQPQ
ncbi:hypothetical protein [Ruegeria halocynthiae]|uniref:hypothetical protein n=1 Tax=Ruegeria halocynthiae TaxID=985054 RepID=UPI000560FEB3|nr:hypothetical protein [Ruegeria halocynthiae]